MIYYRVAVQSELSSSWQWQSGTLTSKTSVFDVLNAYIPRTALRVFLSCSPACLDEMLTSTNKGLASISITAEQFLQGQHMSPAEMKRLALEMDTDGDHDSPYMFTLPADMQQVLAWTKLLTKVHNGELKP